MSTRKKLLLIGDGSDSSIDLSKEIMTSIDSATGTLCAYDYTVGFDEAIRYVRDEASFASIESIVIIEPLECPQRHRIQDFLLELRSRRVHRIDFTLTPIVILSETPGPVNSLNWSGISHRTFVGSFMGIDMAHLILGIKRQCGVV